MQIILTRIETCITFLVTGTDTGFTDSNELWRATSRWHAFGTAQRDSQNRVFLVCNIFEMLIASIPTLP